MAAHQKAVESMAEGILQREEHLVVTDHADHSERVARESHSEKENHSVRDLSAKDRKEEASVRVVREDHHSEKERASETDHADHSERTAKDVHSEKDRKEDLLGRTAKGDLSVKENHSVTDRTEETSVRAEKEDHQEASATESPLAQDSIQAARASTERISTSSAMRRRAASIR